MAIEFVALAPVAALFLAAWHREHRKIQRRRSGYAESVESAMIEKKLRLMLDEQEPADFGTAFWADPDRWNNAPVGEDGRHKPFWLFQRRGS